MRPLCKICGFRPCAVNYRKDDRTFFRSSCECCSKNKGIQKDESRWFKSGYRQKNFCEKCGFKSANPEQFNVFHTDGNLNNCRITNLKTICANCQRILQKEGYKWKQGHLVPDF